MSIFKTALVGLVASGLVMGGVSTPRPANAAIGGGMVLSLDPLGIPLLKVGGLILAAGASSVAWGWSRRHLDNSDKVITLTLVGGVLTALVGVLILENDSESQIRFQTLSEESSGRLGVLVEEREAYNAELDQIQAISETIDAELSQVESPSVEMAQVLWEDYGAELSPEAMSALVKVVSQAVSSVE